MYENISIETYFIIYTLSVKCGREHEAEGITAVQNALGVKVVPCGILGASPNGLIGENASVVPSKTELFP